MKPHDEVQRDLVLRWIGKADQDLAAAETLDAGRFRTIIAFHSQQAVEKYLKALLVRHQIYFPNTHDIARLVALVATRDPGIAAAGSHGADSLWRRSEIPQRLAGTAPRRRNPCIGDLAPSSRHCA